MNPHAPARAGALALLAALIAGCQTGADDHPVRPTDRPARRCPANTSTRSPWTRPTTGST